MSDEYDDMIPIKQLKLSNGDEVICKMNMKHILSHDEWIPVQDALTMWLFDDAYEDDLVTRYAFKPWMSLQDNVRVEVNVKSDNIIAYYTPSVDIITKYLEIIDIPVVNKEEEVKKPALSVVVPFNKADTESMD